MPIKFKRRKKITHQDLEKALIHFFEKNDKTFKLDSNPKVRKGITRPDITVSSKEKNFLIELKTHAPMLSDISMVNASVESFREENQNFVPIIIYPSEPTRDDVSKFADDTGVKLVSLKKIEDIDEKMNQYYI